MGKRLLTRRAFVRTAAAAAGAVALGAALPMAGCAPAGDVLREEEYPVILDDTFVFYDDRRLKNTLKWLAGYRKQALIFTCQKREAQMLDELGIEYRLERI